MLSPHLPCHVELFQTFIDRKILTSIARKQTRNTSLSWEDAAQFASEKLWQATQQGRFRGDIEHYCRWASTVACCAIIDYVRRENRQQCESLNQLIPGTEIALLDTLVDKFDALDAIAQTDLLLDVVAVITALDRRYPQRHYQKIWQGLVQSKKQVQIAEELSINQTEVSKRWREIRQFVAQSYDLDQQRSPEPNRQRSHDQW